MNKIKELYSFNPSVVANKTSFAGIEGLGKVSAATYGEFTYEGGVNFVKYFKDHLGKDAVFYDIGSGFGKLVIHIGMETNVKKSVGVELSLERHEKAVELYETYASEYNNIVLARGNVLKLNLSDATFVYVDNTCFGNGLCEQIWNMLPNGCLVTSKRPWPTLPLNKQEKVADLFHRNYFQSHIIVCTKGDK